MIRNQGNQMIKKGFENWIELFESGTHKDSRGREKTWTNNELDKIVSNYNESNHEAPITIGHPTSSAPAFGWLQEVKREGNVLLGKFKQVNSEFSEMVQEGLFKKRSISLTPDCNIKHIAFLGAKAPAIKGLKDIEFSHSEQDDFIYESADFSEWKNSIVARLFQRMRDYFIDKDGLETADTLISSWDIDALKEPEKAPVEQSFEEPTQEELDLDKLQQMQAELDAQKARVAEFEEANKQKDIELQQAQAKLAEQEKAAKRADYEAFCDDLVKKGHLLPAQRNLSVEFMSMLEDVGDYEFEEGKKTSPVEKYKEMLTSLPKQMNYEEFAKKGKAADYQANLEDPQEIAKKALEYQEAETNAGRTISIDQAVRHITG